MRVWEVFPKCVSENRPQIMGGSWNLRKNAYYIIKPKVLQAYAWGSVWPQISQMQGYSYHFPSNVSLQWLVPDHRVIAFGYTCPLMTLATSLAHVEEDRSWILPMMALHHGPTRNKWVWWNWNRWLAIDCPVFRFFCSYSVLSRTPYAFHNSGPYQLPNNCVGFAAKWP